MVRSGPTLGQDHEVSLHYPDHLPIALLPVSPQVDTELREVEEVIILTCHRAPLGTRPTIVRTYEPLLCSGPHFCPGI